MGLLKDQHNGLQQGLAMRVNELEDKLRHQKQARAHRVLLPPPMPMLRCCYSHRRSHLVALPSADHRVNPVSAALPVP